MFRFFAVQNPTSTLQLTPPSLKPRHWNNQTFTPIVHELEISRFYNFYCHLIALQTVKISQVIWRARLHEGMQLELMVWEQNVITGKRNQISRKRGL